MDLDRREGPWDGSWSAWPSSSSCWPWPRKRLRRAVAAGRDPTDDPVGLSVTSGFQSASTPTLPLFLGDNVEIFDLDRRPVNVTRWPPGTGTICG